MEDAKKTNKRKILLMAGIALVVILLALSIVINLGSTAYEATTYSMGSYVTQRVYGNEREDTAKEVANNIAKLDDMISWRIENSDIERLNIEAGGEFVDVGQMTYNLLELSKDVSELSDGAFDVTIAPLSRLWDFDRGDDFVPDEKLISELLPHVNYKNILLDDGKAALKTSMTMVDLGSIGKGAACDVAIETYKKSKISRAIVAVGGSVGVYGSKSFGADWNIAVRTPKPNTAETMGELSISEGFISTSGSYEKGFEQSGELYHHILDPKTGFPVKNELISVTVLSGSGALSDALSTAGFVLGLEDGMALLEEYDAEGIFITEDSKVFLTNGFSDETDGKFKIIDNSYVLAE